MKVQARFSGKLGWIGCIGIACGAAFTPTQATQTETAPAAFEHGKALYEFYCYQCHGYAGDARTLAATFLDPHPRNFTATDPAVLTRGDMIEAISTGRPGTAMVSFSSVLDPAAIEQVVDYVRAQFMDGTPAETPAYHTPENGWENHRRFLSAFPFATGEITLDTPLRDLTPEQRGGRALFTGSCISCHDHGRADERRLVWELRPLSYPRRHYDHTQPLDSVSGASPYAVHDAAPSTTNLSKEAARGRALFQDNCAFCHAADGTGRNWIGSFLEPHPRNLTLAEIKTRDPVSLRRTIAEGLPGTSMPTWKRLLSDRQIDDVVEYVQCCLPPSSQTASAPEEPPPSAENAGLEWQAVGTEANP